MSKKNKKAKQKKAPLTVNAAWKTALPVVIGIVLIGVLALVFWAVNRDRPTPSIDHPNQVFLTLDGHEITNEDLYYTMRYSQGVSEVKELVDTAVLANYSVKTDKPWYQTFETFKEEYIVGTDYEGSAEEKADEIADWLSDLKQSGYSTDEAVNAYLNLQYLRDQYAREVYYTAIASEFTETEIITKYSSLHEDSYTGLVIVFNSEDEAKAIMKLFGIDASKSTTTGGFAEYIADSIKAVDFTIDGGYLKYKYADQEASAYANLIALSSINETAASATTLDGAPWWSTGTALPDDSTGTTGDLYFQYEAGVVATVYQKGETAWASLKDLTFVDSTVNFLSKLDAGHALINMYNYVNCWYNPDYDYNTNTNPLTIAEADKVLQAGVHYQEIDTDDDGIADEIELLPAGEDLTNKPLVKYNYLYSELTDTTIQTQMATTLSVNKTAESYVYASSYTATPKATSTGTGTNYYLAWKTAETLVTDYLFTAEEAEGIAEADKAAYDALKTEAVNALTQDYYDAYSANEKEKALYQLRKDANLVIYDPFIETMYTYAHNYFYGTTLGLEETEYEAMENKGEESRKVAFSFDVDGTNKEVTAEELFQSMKKKYSVILSTDWLYNYVLVADTDYNNVYNPYSDEILDRTELVDIIDTTIKNYKLYFTYDYFSTYGFAGDYGWEHFMKDYFLVDSERELAVKLVLADKALAKYTRELYTLAAVQEKAVAEYEDFFSGKTLNIIVSLSRDGDLISDPYPVDVEDATKKYDDTTWNASLDALAKELAEKIYTVAETSTLAKLTDQLDETVDAYNSALYNDATWGVYKRAGLHVKFETESSSDYSNSSSIVEQYMDAMRDIYHDIRTANLLGKDLTTDDTTTTDVVEAPFVGAEAFTTTYGYHMIAISSTTDYTYYSDTDQRWQLTDDELTNYLDYLDDSTVTISDSVKALGEAYYTNAQTAVLENNLVDNHLLALYRQFVADGKVQFADSANNATFNQVLDYIESSLDEEDE